VSLSCSAISLLQFAVAITEAVLDRRPSAAIALLHLLERLVVVP
jgi:hypothetical protein